MSRIEEIIRTPVLTRIATIIVGPKNFPKRGQQQCGTEIWESSRVMCVAGIIREQLSLSEQSKRIYGLFRVPPTGNCESRGQNYH